MNIIRGGLAVLALILVLSSSPLLAQTSGQAPPAQGESVTQSDLLAPAPAAPAPAAAVSPRAGSALGSGLTGSLVDIGWAVGAFILVLLLLYFALKALGRLGRFRGGRGRSVFELRGIQPLDNRNYLAAVEVEGRLIVVGVSQDRITPVAHWYLDDEDGGLDFAEAKLPSDEPVLDIRLPHEEDEPPLDISIADSQRGPKK